MKILRITLRNIASLSGLHTVDFTREPLRSAGLFSISGPTGSGKSTLLDGLCLALYDETPRLHRVGRLALSTDGESQADTRNLLRRGAGSGLAEVAFVGVDGLPWTARWEVRRSRGLSDGALQKVQMTMFRGHIPPAGVGTIETGGTKTQVLEAIKDKIGLSFQQFTRAVLLAQNDFATFLKANDKERAEILQALTGTEQYEAISKSVYEHCQRANHAVTIAQQMLDGSPTLSSDARAEVEEVCKKTASDLEQLEESLIARRSHSDWLSKLVELKNLCQIAEERHRKAAEQVQTAESRRLDLKLTEILGRQAQSLRIAQRQAIERSTQAEAALLEAVKANAQCEAVLKDAALAYDDAKTRSAAQQESAVELGYQINCARDLDAQIVPLEQQFQHSKLASTSATQDYESVRSRLNTKVQERENFVEHIKAIETTRSAHLIYESFMAESTLWAERLNLAIQSESELTRLQQQKDSFKVKLFEAETDSRNGRIALTQQHIVCSEAETILHAAQTSANQFDLELLEIERIQCTANQQALHRLKAQLLEIQELNEADANGAAICRTLIETQVTDEKHRREILEDELPKASVALTTSQQQLQLIKDTLDDHAIRFRQELRIGESCPVCGGTEHPYATLPPDLESVALQTARAYVEEKQRQRDDLRTTSDKLQAACEQRAIQLTQRTDELQRVKQRLGEYQFESTELPIVAFILSLQPEQQLSASEAKSKELDTLSKDIAAQTKQQRDTTAHAEVCRQNLEKQREIFHRLELELSDLEKTLVLSNQQLIQAAELVQKEELHQSATLQELQQVWLSWPAAKDEYTSSPELFLTRFREGTSKCIQLRHELDQLCMQLRATEADLAGLQEQTSTAQSTSELRARELETVIGICEQIRAQRMKLLGGRSVLDTETELHKGNKEVEQLLERTQNLWREADKHIALAGKQVQDCQTAASAAQLESSQTSSTMTAWLNEFCQSRECKLTFEELDERLKRDQHWLETERTLLDRLASEASTAEGACQAQRQNLKSHLDHRPTTDTAEVVSADLDLLQKSFEDVRKCNEHARAELKSDDDLRQLNSARLLELKQLEQQARPWQQLDQVIGSATGDKFRMIAQRRTLDLLLRFSNQQLRQLAPRYRIERLNASLNLIVVDCDMGDERRSIHSLSGGELFLVSLAMALGLASLTSDRVRVESLFIDEGFGSLDADSLNTVMGALMQLESQGRKVGVISHVQEMTDVIPVQIKVQKGQGGASRIVIPGNSNESECYELHAIDGNIDNPNADVVESNQVTLCGNNSVAHHTSSNLLNNI
jgi:DNA repair protein SbcC/Rad50